ncbi:MAG: Gfo/Idh/MocA family oxidoreductase [Blautia sp.]|nr:Gfo/Idh/MocA family oxidoreductase [Blautia sp.]MCM1201380.1 Gfo/Idh/MocA family oxidoreductase [Bacteroides fragilis]
MKAVYEEVKDPILKFGFNHRYHNSVIEAKALLDSGVLGEIVCARGVYGKAGAPAFQNEWRNQREVSGGGIMLDQGIHMLDLMYYFMGKFTDIQSTVDQLVWKDMMTEDSAFSILRTADGKVASLHSCAIQWRHKFSLDLICTEGFISLNGLLTSTMSYGEEKITYYRKDLECRTGGLGKPIEHTMCFDSDESWNYEIREFYDAVVRRTPVKEGTIEDAVNLMEMLERIYTKGENYVR